MKISICVLDLENLLGSSDLLPPSVQITQINLLLQLKLLPALWLSPPYLAIAPRPIQPAGLFKAQEQSSCLCSRFQEQAERRCKPDGIPDSCKVVNNRSQRRVAQRQPLQTDTQLQRPIPETEFLHFAKSNAIAAPPPRPKIIL